MSKSGIELNKIVEEINSEIPILRQRIENTLNADSEIASQGLLEVLKFLFLISHTNQKLTPSQKVDLVWHELILCTKMYDQICKTHFDRFIHHHPGGKDEENRQQFKNTLKAYNEYFGEPPYFFWGTDNNFENCGSCEAV
ncbi:MAG: hypothetical protein D8M58_15975 [Calditrichaeota bacterium]|nr:MAG: hypothetical protein DWQ03_07705 [Calditrichota bacterium]MBL1206903.1 hypothetical protein [Calditrichota bacterium]NOG46729.1 hypothetical protein [Calditrichota bacterium]